jgi:hypothetical protein
MYQIACDRYILYDPRDDDLVLLNPRCNLAVNAVGEASFTILPNHPYYDKLRKLKSIFEIRHDEQVIFRGRMTNDSRDFYNQLDVDLEGVLAFANDTIIPPFSFPSDFPDAASAGNMVEYFLQWILDQHNGQAQEWQRLKLGNVTVADPNNYITRSSENYASTWETLKTKLFDSALGGYLLIRYEADGNYVDYVSGFELTNTQHITFGENLLDITNVSDANTTYSAVLPIGAEIGEEDNKYTLTLENYPNGNLTDDLMKLGKFVYSKSAVDAYGWICAPIEDTTWSDVTVADNLKNKAMEYLTGTGMLLSGTITIKAVDLSFTDDEIESFRIYRNILVNSPVHGVSDAVYQLTKLEIDILNPQNTVITIGDTVRTLIDINRQQQTTQTNQNESVIFEVRETRSELVELQNQMLIQNTQVINDCNQIILAALESYVETSNYEGFRETVSTQLQILSDEILMSFTSTTEHITDVDGDLQGKFNELYNYISFANGGITLGSNENAITLTIENDMIVFKKNNVQFGWWDGVDFHTGNIVVEVNERAQFGNFAFIPRSDGSLMFLKVGG